MPRPKPVLKRAEGLEESRLHGGLHAEEVGDAYAPWPSLPFDEILNIMFPLLVCKEIDVTTGHILHFLLGETKASRQGTVQFKARVSVKRRSPKMLACFFVVRRKLNEKERYMLKNKSRAFMRFGE